jgi:major membrane immunogen (membrane-anchored lipoprotein)
LILLPANRFQGIRQRTIVIAFVLCCMCLPIGCGSSEVEQSTMPSAEFAAKLEKEHPELFSKKVGQKIEKLDGRDKRAIIREEWQKSQQ